MSSTSPGHEDEHGHGRAQEHTQEHVQEQEISSFLQGSERSYEYSVVPDPEPAGKSGSKHDFYLVSTATTRGARQVWSARRRYRDFLRLRFALVERFPGAVIPHLPHEKNMGVFRSKAQIQAKQAPVLGEWLVVVGRHPFLSRDDTVHAFLASPVPFPQALKELEATEAGSRSSLPSSNPNRKSFLGRLGISRGSRDLAFSGGGGTSPPSPPSPPDDPTSLVARDAARRRWLQALEMAPEPDNVPLLADHVDAELQELRKTLFTFKNSIKAFVEKQKAAALSFDEFSHAIRSWQALEGMPPVLKAVSDVERPVAPILAQTAAMAGEQAQTSAVLVQRTVDELLASVRAEIALIDAFRAQVSNTRDKYEARVKAQREVDALHDELDVLRSKTGMAATTGAHPSAAALAQYPSAKDEAKMKQVSKQLEDAEAKHDSAVTAADSLIKATLNVELLWFRDERAVRVEHMMTRFARIEADCAVTSARTWGANAKDAEFLKAAANVDAAAATAASRRRSGTIPGVATPRASMVLSRAMNLGSEWDASGLRGGGVDVKKNDAGVEGIHGMSDDDDDEGDDVGEQSGLDEHGLPVAADLAGTEFDVEVVYEFEAEHDDELSCVPGERGVAVVYDADHQWLLVTIASTGSGTGTETGELAPRQGLVPVSYVDILGRAGELARPDTSGAPVAGAPATAFTEQAAGDDSGVAEASILLHPTESPPPPPMPSELKKLKSAVAELEAKLMTARLQAQEWAENAARATAEAQTASAELEEHKEDSRKLQKELIAVRESKEELLRDVAVLQELVRAKGEELHHQEEETQRARAELEAARALVRESGESLVAATSARARLEAEMEQLRAQTREAAAAAAPASPMELVHMQVATGEVVSPSALASAGGLTDGVASPGTDTPKSGKSSSSGRGGRHTPKSSGGGRRGLWIKRWDANYERYFYHNRRTKESVWVAPPDFVEGEGDGGMEL